MGSVSKQEVSMESGCKFKAAAKCESCEYVRFMECSLFRQQLILACGHALRPFRLLSLGSQAEKLLSAPVVYGFTPLKGKATVHTLQKNALYQSMGSLLKSVAVARALRDYGGLPVQHFGVDSIVNTCYSYNKGEYQFGRGVYFMELVDTGGRSECLGFVDSFISLVLGAGGVVCLQSSWFLPTIGVDWARISLGTPSKQTSGASSSFSDDF